MKKWLLTVSTLFLSSTLFAGNTSFYNYSPISFFDKSDAIMMNANMQTALDNYADGKKASWKNPSTGAFGYAIPSHTRKQNGWKCRDLTIFNSARDVTSKATYKFCKINNEWKIAERD